MVKPVPATTDGGLGSTRAGMRPDAAAGSQRAFRSKRDAQAGLDRTARDFGKGLVVPPFVSVAKRLKQTKGGMRAKTPKSRRARRFPLPARAVEALKARRATQGTCRRMCGKDYATALDPVSAAHEGAYPKPDSDSAKVA